jgi:leucyl aminopeptidase
MNNSMHLKDAEDKLDQANSLRERQEQKASDLENSNSQAIENLQRHQDIIMTGLMDSHTTTNDPEDARTKAAQAVSSSQKESVAMLQDAHSQAAKELKDANVKAASELKAAHEESKEKQHEKDQVISWMRGDYSLNHDSSQ